MRISKQVENHKNLIKDQQQANMISELYNLGLIKKPKFELSYGPDQLTHTRYKFNSIKS